jgi:hypothetical protein
VNSTGSQPKHLVRLSSLRGRASKSEQSQNQANALRATMTTLAVSTYDRGLTDPRELSGLEAL